MSSATHEPIATLMLVEKSDRSQEALRQFFASLQIRALITASPDRALNRLAEPSPPARGIICSAIELGDAAVDAFNSMATSDHLRHVPALLIANPKQRAVADRAQCDDLRKIVFVPMKIPDVIAALSAILDIEPPAPGGSLADTSANPNE
ncbi:MAG: hypothetical protein ACKOEX_13750 [Planctomycetia bacterium]